MRLLYTICTYQGKQYTMTEDMEDNTLLYTDNRDLADESFTEIEEGTWRKIVDPWDLKDVYHIDTYGIYQGHRVMIIGGDDRLQTMIICIYDEVLAEEWGMEKKGLGEVYEEKGRLLTMEDLPEVKQSLGL